MNLRQPFEHLIAGKLRQLPAPDADTSWQQMKRLLDDEDNRGGGGKRPPGNGGWWRTGIIGVVLIASCWLFIEKGKTPDALFSKNNIKAGAAPAATTGETSKPNNDNKIASIDNNTTLPLGNNTKATSTTTAVNNANAENAAGSTVINAFDTHTTTAAVNDNPTITTSLADKSAVSNITPSRDGKSADKKIGIAKIISPAKLHAPAVKDDLVNSGNKTEKNISHNGNGSASSLHQAGKNLYNKKGVSKAGLGDNNRLDGLDNEQPETLTAANNARTQALKNNGVKENNAANTMGNANNQEPVTPTGFTNTALEKSWQEKLNELKIAGNLLYTTTALSMGDSMVTSRNTDNLLSNETKKAVARAQRDKAFEMADKKERRKLHLDLSNLFKPFSLHMDTEPWWAAGIALNSGITVNAQNRYNYNVNAKSGIIADYIPSPYLQFHLNNYVYFQTELNFSTPQYTPQLLVYRNNSEIGAAGSGTSNQKSIYIQKLYYFNWPVSLHYSPISNLYFSGGIQFSSFQSGLAAIEQKQYPTASSPDHATGISNTVLKFKDDSIAAKIAPNEWRWQAGAEYYWNRFSVGLRYNQSFKKAINTMAAPSLPATVNRNESLLFFIRYNLFESRKKDNTGAQTPVRREA